MSHPPFYVTTPIYYVNDQPHIGHAYTTILADVLARTHRLLGHPTWFLTGTDEHGQKVQEAATKRGLEPQAHVDDVVVRFQEMWKRMEITNDDFIRTTEPRHTRVVQQILQDLFDRGEIYKAEYDGLYDVRSETFINERDLPPGIPLSELPHIKQIKEANYFFRMGKYQEWLIGYIRDNPGFIQPDHRRNETLGFLQKPLADLCISRPKTRLNWGIDLPFDSDYVTYVWFDALVNYISGVGYTTDSERFSQWWPASLQLIGKDILTTHTVYWPTMLKAMGLPMPHCIFAHGWWLSGDDKMSKSLGNVANPIDYADRFGVDAFRYFLMAEMNLGQDASFTEDIFVRRYNADLANDLGNLVSRVFKLLQQYHGGTIPEAPQDLVKEPEQQALWDKVVGASALMEKHLHGMRLDLGVHEAMNAVREVNRYIGNRAPWKQAKDEDSGPFRTTMRVCLEAMRVCASLLSPVMPGKMQQLLAALGADTSPSDSKSLVTFGQLATGHLLGDATSLFPRYIPVPSEKETSPEKPVAPVPAATVPAPTIEGVIEYGDFSKVQLRSARILSAEKITGADKLLKLSVEVGTETRTIVAGIAQHFSPESLPGKTIVVVANLKPVKLRGIESQGMLLACTVGDSLRLVTVEEGAPSGCVIK